MNKFIQNKILLIANFILSFIIFIIYTKPFELVANTVFYNFQARDIFRAREILNGNLILYGPEMTGGGNLPGPLYYVVLAIGQLFEHTWKSAWLIEYGFVYLAAILGFFFFKKRNINLAYLWLLLFSSAPFTSWFIKIFLNVSMLIPFTVAAIILILKSFENDSSDRKKYLYWASFIIGIGLQFHFSIICLFFAIFLIQSLHKKLDITGQNRTKLLKASLIFILPSIPHLLWLIANRNGIEIGREAFYSGAPEQSINSLIYLLKINSNITKLIHGLPEKFFLTFPLFLICSFPILLKLKKIKTTTEIKLLLIISFCTFIPYLSWYFSGQAIRYTIPFYISCLFLFLILLEQMLEEESYFKKVIFTALLVQIGIFYFEFKELSQSNLGPYILKVLLIVFGFTLVLLAMNKLIQKFSTTKKFATEKFNIRLLLLASSICFGQIELNPDYLFTGTGKEGYMPTYSDWKKINSIIYQNTGWNLNDIQYKTYYVGHHVNQSPSLAFEGFSNERLNLNKETISPDGFFISNRYDIAKLSRTKKSTSPKKWLLKQNLHIDLIAALENDEIILGNNLSTFNLIVPYWVKDTYNIPKHIHNRSEGYNISAESLELEKIKAPEGVLKISEDEFLFKWNENKDQNKYCSTGAKIDLIKSKNNHNDYQIKIRVIGATLSQITPWISPNWTQAWISPYLKIVCNNETLNYKIAESIGFRRIYSHRLTTPFFAGNNSFSAPFEREFNFTCKNKPRSISVGRLSSEIEMITKVKTIPGKELSVAL